MGRRKKRKHSDNAATSTTENNQKNQPTIQSAPTEPEAKEEKVEVIDPNTYSVAYYLSLVPIWSFLTNKLGGYPNESISMQLYCYAYFSDETKDEAGNIVSKANRRIVIDSPAVLSMTVRSVGFDEQHSENPMRHVLIEGTVLASTCNNSESKSPTLQPKAEFKGARGYKIFLAGSNIKIICNLDARVGAVISVKNRKGTYHPYVPLQFDYNLEEVPPPCP